MASTIFDMNTPILELFRTWFANSARWITKQFNLLLVLYLFLCITPVWTFLTDAFFPPDVAWPYIFFLWPPYTFLYGYAIVSVLIRGLKRSMRIPLILCLNLALLVTTYWTFKATYGQWLASSLTYTFLNYLSMACILLHIAEPLLRGEMKMDVKIVITVTEESKRKEQAPNQRSEDNRKTGQISFSQSANR